MSDLLVHDPGHRRAGGPPPVLPPRAAQAHAQRVVRELRIGTVRINAASGSAASGAATRRGASGDGFGYGPELLDELTRVRVASSRRRAEQERSPLG